MSIPPLDVMSDEDLCAVFDAYIKMALRNKSRNLVRDYRRRLAHEVSVCDVEQCDTLACHVEIDTTIECNVLRVADMTCIVNNDKLYLALCQLDEKHLLPLVLKYWFQWQDEESASYCGVTMNAIRKRRKNAIERLRLLLRSQGRIVHGVGSRTHSKGSNG